MTSAAFRRPAQDARPAVVACFAVSALAGPQMLSRIVEPIAKRGLLPERCVMVRSGPDEMTVDLQVGGLDDPHLVETIAGTLRAVVGVESVLTAMKRPREQAA